MARRRTESVADMIRRNNGGFLASEISSGSAPGGQAAVTPGPYMDTRLVGSRRWVPDGKNMSLRKHWVGRNVPVARDRNGRPVPMPADPSKLGGNPIGGFGTPGAPQGRQANGSPIPGALPAYMTYDKRFPDSDRRQTWLQEHFGKQAKARFDEASTGLSTKVTGNNATGAVISREYSPMAVAPGVARPGNTWDAIRAGVENQATQQAIFDFGTPSGVKNAGSLDLMKKHGPVDMADQDSVKSFTDAFKSEVDRNKGILAGRFVDNMTQSVRDNIDRNWKPSGPKPSEASGGASLLHDTAISTGDTGLTRETFNDWRKSAGANQPKTEIQQKTVSGDTVTRKVGSGFAEWQKQAQAQNDADQRWIKDFAKQSGLKDPTQSAARGGRSGTPVAKHRRSDTLGSLIEDLDRYGEYEPMYGETELTEKELVDYDAARARARDANLPVDDPRYRRDEPSGKVYRKWSMFDLSDGERALLRREGADAEVEALRAMFDYAKAGGEGARNVRDIRNLAWNLRRNREAGR